MKKYFLLLISLLNVGVFAQAPAENSYRPFIEEGKVWYTMASAAEAAVGYPDKYLRQYIAGDTLVAERTCKKWMQQEVSYATGTQFMAVYAYEEKRQVWFFYEGDTIPRLMFDFGAEVGDTLVVYEPNAHAYDATINLGWKDMFPGHFTDTIVIRRVAEELEGGRVQRKLWYSEVGNEDYSPWNCLMEGVGSHINPHFNQRGSRGSSYLQLIGCFVGDDVLFLDSDYAAQTGVPLPTSITAPSSDAPSANGKCFDLAGRPLPTTPMQRGIYIRDGKKVGVR